MHPTRALAALVLLPVASACGSPTPVAGGEPPPRFGSPLALPVLGLGEVPQRTTSELWVHGRYAYTGTHGTRDGNLGNVINVWDVAGPLPLLVDSLRVPDPPPGPAFHLEGEDEGHAHATAPDRVGDLQVSDDGRLLLAATEGGPGSIVLYDLADPAHPALLVRYATPAIEPGVHTAELARVGGRLYAFLSVDPSHTEPARLVIVDLGDPAHPREVWARAMGRPIQHDVFVRDGILFTAMWHDGVAIWDVGGGGRGGSVENPVQISTLQTEGGSAHNLWWYRDGRTGARRWLFVGDERPGGARYGGDVHVVDVSDLARPREVGFFHVEGAGAHNFSVDEEHGILYAAFYNAGVRALDVRGDLAACSGAERAPDGRCDLARMGREAGRGLHDAGRDLFVWGVQYRDGALYASDMPNGLWKLDASALR